MIRPTNPMGPVSAVTRPVRVDPATYPVIVSAVVDTPRDAAQSSPTASRFHCGAFMVTNKHTGTTAAASQPMVEYSTASSPPISHREIANDCEKVARLCRNMIIAKDMLFIVTPVNSSVNDDRRRP